MEMHVRRSVGSGQGTVKAYNTTNSSTSLMAVLKPHRFPLLGQASILELMHITENDGAVEVDGDSAQFTFWVSPFAPPRPNWLRFTVSVCFERNGLGSSG